MSNSITYGKLLEKFKDKGYNEMELFFIFPYIPIFDPSCWQLQNCSREELRKRFEETELKRYIERLEDLSIWIDYQKHK